MAMAYTSPTNTVDDGQNQPPPLNLLVVRLCFVQLQNIFPGETLQQPFQSLLYVSTQRLGPGLRTYPSGFGGKVLKPLLSTKGEK